MQDTCTISLIGPYCPYNSFSIFLTSYDCLLLTGNPGSPCSGRSSRVRPSPGLRKFTFAQQEPKCGISKKHQDAALDEVRAFVVVAVPDVLCPSMHMSTDMSVHMSKHVSTMLMSIYICLCKCHAHVYARVYTRADEHVYAHAYSYFYGHVYTDVRDVALPPHAVTASMGCDEHMSIHTFIHTCVCTC